MSTDISTEQLVEDISPGSDFSGGFDFDNNNNNNNNNNDNDNDNNYNNNNNKVRIVCGDLNTNIKREMNRNSNNTTKSSKNSRTTTKHKNYYYYRHGGLDRSHPESIFIPDEDLDEPLTTDDQFVGEWTFTTKIGVPQDGVGWVRFTQGDAN